MGQNNPASGPDNLDAVSLGDVSVDVMQTPPAPSLDPAISITDNSSLHVRCLCMVKFD